MTTKTRELQRDDTCIAGFNAKDCCFVLKAAEKLYRENETLKKEIAAAKKDTREVIRLVIWKMAEYEGSQVLHYNDWVDDHWKELLEQVKKD